MRDFTLDAVPGDTEDYMELADADSWTCRDCTHIHAELKGGDRLVGEVLTAMPEHEDICDCDTPLPMVCRWCGTDTPDDWCVGGRCDDPRTP